MQSRTRFVVTLILASALVAAPTVSLAQEATGTASQGAAEGEMAGKRDTNGCLWMGGGFLFGLLGVGAAYVIAPSPPAMQMLGKSSEYVAAYTDAYVRAAKNVQTSNAWTGCIANGVVGVVYAVVVVVAAAAAAGTGY